MTERKTRAKRRPFRREEIMEAAAAMFHERGYEATGMDDIGRAVGISGPAIYRHFKSKDDILNSIVFEGWDEIAPRIAEIIRAGGGNHLDTLTELVRQRVNLFFDKPNTVRILVHQLHVLQPQARAAFQRYTRLYLEEWVHVLAQLRPELSDGEARVLVYAAWGVIESSLQYQSGLDRQLVEQLLVSAALQVLVASDATLIASPPAAARRLREGA